MHRGTKRKEKEEKRRETRKKSKHTTKEHKSTTRIHNTTLIFMCTAHPISGYTCWAAVYTD